MNIQVGKYSWIFPNSSMYYGIVGNLTNDEFVLKQNLLLHVENFAKIFIAIYCNMQ